MAPGDVGLGGVNSGVVEGGGVGDVVMPGVSLGGSDDFAGAAVVEGAEFVKGMRVELKRGIGGRPWTPGTTERGSERPPPIWSVSRRPSAARAL